MNKNNLWYGNGAIYRAEYDKEWLFPYKIEYVYGNDDLLYQGKYDQLLTEEEFNHFICIGEYEESPAAKKELGIQLDPYDYEKQWQQWIIENTKELKEEDKVLIRDELVPNWKDNELNEEQEHLLIEEENEALKIQQKEYSDKIIEEDKISDLLESYKNISYEEKLEKNPEEFVKEELINMGNSKEEANIIWEEYQCNNLERQELINGLTEDIEKEREGLLEKVDKAVSQYNEIPLTDRINIDREEYINENLRKQNVDPEHAKLAYSKEQEFQQERELEH